MNLTEILSKGKKSIVAIEVVKNQGSQASLSVRGTGFFVNKNGLIASCAHVYNELPQEDREFLMANICKDSKGKLDFYKRVKISLDLKDDSNDVALFNLKNVNEEYAPLTFGNSDQIDAGEEVASLGFPLATEMIGMRMGMTLMANKCIIGNVKPNKNGKVIALLLNTHSAPGSSGSPLFSLRSGKVIGMIARHINQTIKIDGLKEVKIPQAISMAIPSNTISETLKGKS